MKSKIKIKKSYIGAFFLALALWGYTKLNGDYRIRLDLPLNVEMPPNRAIENVLPKTLKIEIRGKGWDLFNLVFFGSNKKINLDLSNQNITKNNIEVGRQQILKSVDPLGDLQPIDVLPEYFEIRTGVSGEYFVNIVPDLNIKPSSGFTLIDEVNIKPERVKIKGNNKVVSNISNWKTKNITLENLNSNFRRSVPLSDTLSSIVELSRKYVSVIGKIEQIAEKTFYDIPLKVINGNLEGKEIFPKRLNITIRGGLSFVSKVQRDDLSIYINKTDIDESENGLVQINYSIPENIEIIQPNDLIATVYNVTSKEEIVQLN